jgi:hypothetical protein
MSSEETLTKYRIVSTGAFLSGLVGLDLFLNFFCAAIPLLFYLIVGGLGAWIGGVLHARLSSISRGAKFVRSAGVFLALFFVCGVVLQIAIPVNWDTKCAWRHCGRAMSPGLLKSPFSVGTPSCSAWWKCANEYPFTPTQYDTALQRMDNQGCEAP